MAPLLLVLLVLVLLLVSCIALTAVGLACQQTKRLDGLEPLTSMNTAAEAVWLYLRCCCAAFQTPAPRPPPPPLPPHALRHGL
jgi:hypothetical protein